MHILGVGKTQNTTKIKLIHSSYYCTFLGSQCHFLFIADFDETLPTWSGLYRLATFSVFVLMFCHQCWSCIRRIQMSRGQVFWDLEISQCSRRRKFYPNYQSDHVCIVSCCSRVEKCTRPITLHYHFTLAEHRRRRSVCASLRQFRNAELRGFSASEA